MPVGGETSQLSHTLKKKKKKKNRCRWSGDPVSAVGGETSQLSHAETLKKQQKIFLNEKSEKKKIAVGVCGTVFRSFLIFTVISCLLSTVLYQIFVVSAWLTFVFVMFASVSRTEKKKLKKKKNRRRCVWDCFS